jgi:hypothetical protein
MDHVHRPVHGSARRPIHDQQRGTHSTPVNQSPAGCFAEKPLSFF